MNRKSSLSLARYVATICIAVFHFEWIYMKNPVLFGLFYIWVEFFFVMSGFFVGIYHISCQRNLLYAISFWFKKQIKKQYPLYILAAFINFIVQTFAMGWKSIEMVFYELFQQRWEYLGLVPFIPDAKVYNIVGPAQQIPITIMGGVTCMFLGKLLSRSKRVVFPMCSMGILGAIVMVFGNLSQWTSRLGIVPTGIARGLAEMIFGYWLATEVLPRIKQSKNQIVLKALSKSIGIVSIAILIGLRNSMSPKWLICFVAVFGIWIVAMYCTENKKTWLVNVTILEKISYPMFLFHGAILSLMAFRWANHGYAMMIPYMFILHLAALMAWGLDKQVRLIITNK